jgi:hypothetical protein
VAISKLFFFPSWKCGDFFIFFWKTLASPCMFSWGTFQRIFVTNKKKKKKKKKKAALHLCVCLSWFKETGGLHSVRRSQVPTSIYIYIILGIPVRYPFGMTRKYLKSRVGISKYNRPVLCRHGQFSKCLAGLCRGEIIQRRNVACRYTNKFRAGPYKRLRDLHQVSHGTYGQFAYSPGQATVNQHPAPARQEG